MAEISYEDKRFFKIMGEQVVKVENHYETPLLLQNPEITLPNKRMMAEKRAHYLKRKFQKDEQYSEKFPESSLKISVSMKTS